MKKIIRLETGNGCTRIAGGTRKEDLAFGGTSEGAKSKEQTGIEFEDKLRGDKDEGKGSERGERRGERATRLRGTATP